MNMVNTLEECFFEERLVTDAPGSNSPQKRYPAIYERSIPLVISLLVITILGLLVITVAVALGLFA